MHRPSLFQPEENQQLAPPSRLTVNTKERQRLAKTWKQP